VPKLATDAGLPLQVRVGIATGLVVVSGLIGTGATPHPPVGGVFFSVTMSLYRELGFKGASSHSGRRTFIAKAAKRCIEGGGSLRDVQQLAGHFNDAALHRGQLGSEAAHRRFDLVMRYLCEFRMIQPGLREGTGLRRQPNAIRR
jgi:hypothetical protein